MYHCALHICALAWDHSSPRFLLLLNSFSLPSRQILSFLTPVRPLPIMALLLWPGEGGCPHTPTPPESAMGAELGLPLAWLDGEADSFHLRS